VTLSDLKSSDLRVVRSDPLTYPAFESRSAAQAI
jgi:hypothetical protein